MNSNYGRFSEQADEIRFLQYGMKRYDISRRRPKTKPDCGRNKFRGFSPCRVNLFEHGSHDTIVEIPYATLSCEAVCSGRMGPRLGVPPPVPAKLASRSFPDQWPQTRAFGGTRKRLAEVRPIRH